MNKKEIIIYNPSKLPTVDYKRLKSLQGDLKTLSFSDFEKLKKSILKYGFRVPAFVWRDSENELWIEDAHQRQKVLVALEEEGYIVPEIPYAEIYAKDKKEAAEMLLQITSKYGEINIDTSFLEDFDLDMSFLEEISIPEFDIALKEGTAGKVRHSIGKNVKWITDEEEALKVHHPDLFKDKENIVIQFSGGKDSTFSLFWAYKNFTERRIIAVFSNTGVEFPGMVRHVIHCCEFFNTEYKIIHPNLDMWDEIERKKSWPTPLGPWCQTEFIHKPIAEYIRVTFDSKDTIVLDGSAAKQSTPFSNKTKTSELLSLPGYTAYHPAFDITRDLLERILLKAKIPLWEGYELGFGRTACWMCYGQNATQAIALARNYPGLVEYIRKYERKLNMPLDRMGKTSIDDLIKSGKRKSKNKKEGRL